MTRVHPLADIDLERVVILDDGVVGGARLQGEAPSSGELSSMAVTDRGGAAQELREQFDRRGYICIPGLFEADDVDAAREAVFSKLKSVGEVTGDPVAGVYSGTSSRRDGKRDLGQFWREVSEQWPLRRLTHSAALHEITGQILAGPTVAQDLVFLRASNPGRHTKVHSDTGFFTRRTDQVVTTWVCLGDIPLELGPLFVIEGSHKHATVLSRNKDFDVARDTDRQASWGETPLSIAKTLSCKVVTRHMRRGDVVIFGMQLLHGALDNVDTGARIRLSCDVRYQASAAPRDPRYFGSNPTGTTGAGYGELQASKALDEEWIVR